MSGRGVRMGFVLVVLTAGGRPAAADEVAELKAMIREVRQDYEEKIRRLEARVAELESRETTEASSEAGAEASVGPRGVRYVGRHHGPVGQGGLVLENPFGFGNVTLGGYFDMEYRDLDGAESTFRQHRWIINIGAQPAERIRFNSELEIENGGPDTAGGDGEIHVEQAYIDYLIGEAVNVRVGAILVPFGRYNLYHDSDLQDLTDRPLAARDIVPTTWTESGAGLFGEWNPVIGGYEDLVVRYEIYGVNGLDAGFSDTGLRGGRSSLKTDADDGKAVVGRVVFSPALGQEVGVSGYHGSFDGDDNLLEGVGLDARFTLGDWEWIWEYDRFDVDEADPSVRDLPDFLEGAYTQLAWHFWPEFLSDTFLGRGFSDPKLTLVGRLGWARIGDDGDAGTGDNEEFRYTIGLNYRPIDSMVFKLEYQINDTKNEALEAGDGRGFVGSVALGF